MNPMLDKGNSSCMFLNQGLDSLSLNTVSLTPHPTGTQSVLLLDNDENFPFDSEEKFIRDLKLDQNEKIKVVSIFGNTGEGKSYTMNHVFFKGEEVFLTSPSQQSCTMGASAKYCPNDKVLCIDTEGLLGISSKEEQRTRLLLKVLAVSDIIIYRTRAERLHRDMYTFLSGAFVAFNTHFRPALDHVRNKSDLSKVDGALVPSVIVFHETVYSDVLPSKLEGPSPEELLREEFRKLNLPFEASSLKYIGIKGSSGFGELRNALLKELKNTSVRSYREPKHIFSILYNLNRKFKGHLSNETPQLNLTSYFTCPEKCQSCKKPCSLSMGHNEDGKSHENSEKCTFQHQYQNCVYLCKQCNKNGNKIIVKPSYQSMNNYSWSSYFNYVWSGYVIECPKCGEIYRSRQHWYGNKNPEDCAVIQEVVHVWPGDKNYFQERALFASQNSAQKVIDGVSSITDVLASVGSQPSKVIGDWVADKIAPYYWTPNDRIKECEGCKTPFEPNAKKHHCRRCGEGFCEGCSSKRQPVPERGWLKDVRVCNNCFQETPASLSTASDNPENRARQIGETVVNSISVMKSVLDIPKEFIKDTARPSYWIPDDQCSHCSVCSKPFGAHLSLHHCRDCGKGVCNGCSGNLKPVPHRGWDTAVRVCNHCAS